MGSSGRTSLHISDFHGATKEGHCGRLRRWLYGMRQAASAWERDYSKKLVAIGRTKGIVAPTVFFWEERGVRCVVHGDDFTLTGNARTYCLSKVKWRSLMN